MDKLLKITQSEKPLIMGILNVTPDSFSDGGRFSGRDQALAHALKMVEQGVDIIDVGGESTRPGADRVSSEEQLGRVLPVIALLRQGLPERCAISIDTTQSQVARAALEAGAHIINDVSAGRDDAEMLALAVEYNAPIVLMHMQGTPKTMQQAPYYQDVVEEVLAFLWERIAAAEQAGIPSENIIIDPGIGFGKRKYDNLKLMADLERFVETGYAVLLGASRKRFMGSICGETEPSELMAATVVTTVLGVMAGVRIFRVHDVKENRQAIDVAHAIQQVKSGLVTD